MKLEEARRDWQAQPLPKEPQMPESEMLDLVKHRSAALDRQIGRRDRREAIVAIVVAILFFPILFTGPWLARAGVLVVLGAFALIMRKLGAARHIEAAERADISLRELLTTERMKLDGQIRLLESVVSWYILPPVAGAMMIVIGLEGWSWFTVGYASFALALSVWIYRLNQRAARHELHPRRAELDRLIQELER
jgi:hypothetical protein